MSSNLIVNNIEVGAGATIYTAASNQLAFGTNGSEKVRIKSDGKVGIGSDDPGATLDLFSNDTEILLRLNTKPVKNGYLDIISDANRRGVIRFRDSLGDGGNYRWSIGNGDSDELVNTSFHISSGNSGGNAAKLVVTSGGSVNIGTGELTQTARKLNVYGGAIRATQTSGGNTLELFAGTTSGQSYGLLVDAGTTSGDYAAHFRKVDNTTIMRIRGDGQIGVGIDAPTFSSINSITANSARGIEIFKNGTDTGSAIKLAGDNGGGTKSWSQLGYSGANATSHWANYNTAGTKTGEIVIGSTGKVGIGTDIPDETLELWKASGTNLVKISTQANSTIGLLLEKTGSTTQSWKIADGQTANGTLEIYDATESETRLAIDGSGRVIIGQHNHSGGGTLVVCGNSNTPNAYGCAAFCKIGANPTSGTTLAQFRFSAGSGGTNRAAEISVQADSNWNDGTNQESKMIFKVATSGGGNTAGSALMTLKGTGDVEINRGNLVMANDKGISFIEADDTATGETVSSSVLDDYEEGSWTTQLMDGNSSNVTYSNSTARYVKVGRMVYCYFNVTRAETGSKTGIMKFYNLPYLSTNSTLQVTGTWWLDEGSPSQNDAVGGPIYVQENSRVALFVYPTSEWQQAGNRYLEFSQWQNGRPMYGSFTYEAAA
jgi:hypothetical protein